MGAPLVLTTLPPAFAAFRASRQFCLYKTAPSRTKPGKLDKFPCDARGQVADAHDPANWLSADEASAAAALYGPLYGVAFVFTAGDPFWFLDIDNALQPDGQWSPLAQQLCAAFAGCAVEVSASGRGLHIFGTGAVPDHSCRNAAAGLELYTEGRFVALTGTHAVGDAGHPARPEVLQWLVGNYFPPRAEGNADRSGNEDGPCPEWRGPTDDDELLRRAMRSQSARSAFGSGASFADLWTANEEVLARAYPADASGSDTWNRSNADAGLAQLLAFWTGRDAGRMERLLWRSSLVRPKWEERDDYLARTIANACRLSRDVLQDKEVETPAIIVDEEAPYTPPESHETAGTMFVDAAGQIEMFKDCVYVRSIHRVLVPSGELLKPEAFRVAYAGYIFLLDHSNSSSTKDAWEAFTCSQRVRHRQAADMCFRPDLPQGAFIRREGLELVNTYKPNHILRMAGDASPFLRHLKRLVPDDRDRAILMAYYAACVQYRGRKFRWAPVLQGVEGNGKTFLSLCVAYAVGQRYTHWPKASKLGAQFNGWMYGKLLYCVEDMYLPKSNLDIVEELKPMITGENLEIEGKGVDQATREICGNFLLNMNGKAGVKKTRNDRRFALFYCPQQTEADLKRDGLDGEYMTDLYDWAKGQGAYEAFGGNYGFAIVAELLNTWTIPPEFNPATKCQRAPITTSTEEAIEASHSPLEQIVVEAMDEELPGFRGGWVSGGKLRDLVAGAGQRCTPHQREALMVGLRFLRHPGLPGGRPNNPVLPDAGRPVLYVRELHPSVGLAGAAEIAAAYEAAQR